MKHSANYAAHDQYGQWYYNLGVRPRKALLERLGRKSARRMYIDKADGSTVHIGWIIAGLWLTVVEIVPMERGPIGTIKELALESH